VKTAKKKKAVKKSPVKRTAKKPAANDMIAFLSQGREVGEKSVGFMLRTCDAKLQGHGGFQWPKLGGVSAPDWKKSAHCGNGLHGLLWGEGGIGYLSTEADAVWMVCAVWIEDVVDIGGDKIKAPRAWVVFCGARDKAVAELQRLGAAKPCFGTSTSGDGGTSTSGDGGTSTSGYGGTSTSGYGGTSTSGDGGTSTSGHGGTSTSGHGGTSTSGDGGTSTSGARGTSTSGYGGTSTSGARGTSTSGARGTSTSGHGGTSLVENGVAIAGEDGILLIKIWNGARYRMYVAHVGEDGILAGVRYKLDDNNAFVRADEAST
jgi:hypothetical protein